MPPVDRLSLSTSCSPEHAEASGFSKPSSGDPLAALVAEDSPSDCPPRPLSSPAAEAALFPEANLQRPQLSPKQTQGGGGAEARRESSGRDASQREIERRQREEEELRREVRELAKKEIEEFYERRSRQIQAMQEHRQCVCASHHHLLAVRGSLCECSRGRFRSCLFLQKGKGGGVCSDRGGRGGGRSRRSLGKSLAPRGRLEPRLGRRSCGRLLQRHSIADGNAAFVFLGKLRSEARSAAIDERTPKDAAAASTNGGGGGAAR